MTSLSSPHRALNTDSIHFLPLNTFAATETLSCVSLCVLRSQSLIQIDGEIVGDPLEKAALEVRGRGGEERQVGGAGEVGRGGGWGLGGAGGNGKRRQGGEGGQGERGREGRERNIL